MLKFMKPHVLWSLLLTGLCTGVHGQSGIVSSGAEGKGRDHRGWRELAASVWQAGGVHDCSGKEVCREERRDLFCRNRFD